MRPRVRSRTSEVERVHLHGAWVQSAQYSPSGHRVATGAKDRLLRVLDAEDLQELFRVVHLLRGIHAFGRQSDSCCLIDVR